MIKRQHGSFIEVPTSGILMEWSERMALFVKSGGGFPPPLSLSSIQIDNLWNLSLFFFSRNIYDDSQ